MSQLLPNVARLQAVIAVLLIAIGMSVPAGAAPQTGWPFMGGTDVAYDPTNMVYLRVGGQPQLLGEFVDEFGMRIGNPFRISTATDDAIHPRVVYGAHVAGGAGGFLVIWTRRTPPPMYGDASDPTFRPSTFTLRSRVVTFAGGPIGSEQLIGLQGEADRLPIPNGAALAYSPASQVFYAVYERLVASTGTPPTDCCSLHGIRLDLNGNAVPDPASAIEIESAVALPRFPAMEWNPTGNEFGITYSVQGFIHFARVNTAGVMVQHKVVQPLIDVYKWERPDIAVNTTLGNYLIAWAEAFAPFNERETETAELDANGTVLRSSRISRPIAVDPRIAYNASSNTFLLVGPYIDPSHLQAQELDEHGIYINAQETLDFGGGVRFGFPVGEGTLTVDQTRGNNYANRIVWDHRVRPGPGNRRWIVSYYSADTLASQVVTLPTGELFDPNPVQSIWLQKVRNGSIYRGNSTVGFRWGGAGAGATYWLDIGLVHGGTQLFSGYGPASGTMGLPVPLSGRPIFVRLWTLVSGQWSYLDYILETPNTAPVMTHDWQPLATVSDAWLYASSTPGGGFGEIHYSREPATATTRMAPSAPYWRVYSRLADRWVSRDFIFRLPSSVWTPQVRTPAPGATITSPNVTFGWAAPDNPTQADWLDVGTTPGGTNLFSGAQTNRPARTVTVPLAGGTIYARFWSLDGQWESVDFAYPAINANGRAVLTAPSFGTVIAQPTARFSWSSVPSATQYWLDIGTTAGGADVYSASQGINTSATVTGLPVTGRPIELDGRPLFVRLWVLTPGAWSFVDAEYQTAAPTKQATLTRPTVDGPMTGSTATFEWQRPAGVSTVRLEVGTGEGLSNLYSATTSATSVTVTGLPSGGAPVHVRLWTPDGPRGRFIDYVFPTQ